MLIRRYARRAAALLSGAGAIGLAAASAHHGWSWAQEDQTEMTGEIVEVYIGPPHPLIEIETEDDGQWTVQLGNPGLTERSGFVEGVAEPGDSITILGHRSLDENEKLMKAVRVTVEGERFDIYPDRIEED